MTVETPPEKLIDPLLHQSVRTRLAAYLATRGQTSFAELKAALGVSDGNLESHLKKLIQASYVSVEKSSSPESGESKGRAQSLYQLTGRGARAFDTYVDAMRRILLGQSPEDDG